MEAESGLGEDFPKQPSNEVIELGWRAASVCCQPGPQFLVSFPEDKRYSRLQGRGKSLEFEETRWIALAEDRGGQQMGADQVHASDRMHQGPADILGDQRLPLPSRVRQLGEQQERSRRRFVLQGA